MTKKQRNLQIPTHIVSLYLKFREHSPFMLVGENAALALRAARTLSRWEDLESKGFVKLETTPDEDCQKDWDCPSHCTKDHPCDACRAYERDGAWETISYYRTDPEGEWEVADSCGGHVGYRDPSSPFENCYVIDEMNAAIDAYTDMARASFASV